MEDNPILNSPYEEPQWHYNTNEQGELDYSDIRKGRRIFVPYQQTVPVKQGPQRSAFEVNDYQEEYGTHLINLVRNEVGKWRENRYPETTRVTRELLMFWFKNPDRHSIEKLFFAQQEAVETAIWLNEVAAKSNAGQNILNQLHEAQRAVSEQAHQQLPRIAFKMATGTGKTVVMACLILYHFFNRQEYPRDTRFSDYFLIVAPSITIRDRLGVLFYNPKSKERDQKADYYYERALVPEKLQKQMGSLNARLKIMNYHKFEPKTLQGNKKSPKDGKIIGYDANGKPIKQEGKEDFNLVTARVLPGFKRGRRLLVLNDEAHHCYLPKSKGKSKDTGSDENAKAAVWFTGISELAKRYKMQTVYDLSATPYYLRGSGYPAYTLFGWVVSDFGLIESIESGLVKIPFLPEKDTTQELTEPVLRNLYDHVKDSLPKQGQRKAKKDAKKEGDKDGKKVQETPPRLPSLVKTALDQFYDHYEKYAKNVREKGEEKVHLFSRPPVFIVVCNNTTISKEMYKFIAGYEMQNANKEKQVVTGNYPMLSNYTEDGILKKKAPTLLIDSDALEDSGQISEDFKKIFKEEITEFKKDYARLYGQGAVEQITDANILREVVNTVGEPGKLGGHIRAVVSVSMLTEGWDANTVTHIMGLRAFGSQLLCEQVAGRALRRMRYVTQYYDRRTGEPISEKQVSRYKPENVVQKFPPEYAHIIGVPFKMFKGGETTIVEPPETWAVFPIKEREEDFEITFPKLEGYRMEYENDTLHYDFSALEDYEIDGSKIPVKTTLSTAFSPNEEELTVQQVLEKREQEILYRLTQALITYYFSDEERNPEFYKFNQLKHIVHEWFHNKIALLNIEDPQYKKLIYFEDPKAVSDHIARGINPDKNNKEYVKPVFHYYDPFSSTRFAHGNTSKDVYPTQKSHINYVVMDSEWEGICAKTLEELDNVESYVKNQFLDFSIPYVKDGKDRQYFTDFIARVKKQDGSIASLLIEITGMNKEKAAKKWYVENRWLPAVNAVKDKYEYNEWHFIEIANDVRNIRNQLIDKINTL